MRVLITGSAGFIGYHLCESYLKDGVAVLGIDNINNYYDTKLKKNRLNQLKKYNNFIFENLDISNKNKLEKKFNSFKPSNVVNLAAQAGVRYSLKNPFAYVESNLVGFVNIVELCKQFKVNGLVYASSSSVYGGNDQIPFSTNHRVDSPISLYAATKRSNELIAHSYSHLHDLHTTGLRFFTVYGPWGRPDMAMFIFVKKLLNDEPIPVFNDGDMKRDFTFITDIINGTRNAVEKNFKCEVFNLGNNKSENLMDVVSLIEKNLQKKANIEFLPIQPGDVKESFADIEKSRLMLNYNPKINIDVGIKKLIEWYLSYYGK